MPGPGCRPPPVPHYTGPLLLRESARALLAARESGHPEWTGSLDLGRSLDTAVDTYNKAVSSLETRVLVTARKLIELNVADGELAAPLQVERSPRVVSAPELVASADESLVALHAGHPGRPFDAAERTLLHPEDRDGEPHHVARATVAR